MFIEQRENRQGEGAPVRPNDERTVPGEERALLKRAAAGDRAAFSDLLDAHYDMIYGAAYRWAGNQADAEDIAQDVCIKVGRAIRSFRMECKFSTWLYRIVLNAARDFARKSKPYMEIGEADRKIGLASDEADPEEKTGQMQLWRMVRRLPAKHRDAVLLVYAEELSHAEAAEVMGSKEATVSWYIHEAKKQLKVLMKDHD